MAALSATAAAAHVQRDFHHTSPGADGRGRENSRGAPRASTAAAQAATTTAATAIVATVVLMTTGPPRPRASTAATAMNAATLRTSPRREITLATGTCSHLRGGECQLRGLAVRARADKLARSRLSVEHHAEKLVGDIGPCS